MSRKGARYTDSRFTIPNVLTGLRIVLAAAAAVCFARGVAEPAAVLLCVIATVLDAFDGWYARTFSQCSSLGEHLDPFADKLLMAVVYGVLAIRMDSPLVWALVALIGARELAMTLFRSYSLRRHRKFIPANRLGKVKMIVQSTVGLAFVAYGTLGGGFRIPVAVVAIPLAGILALSYLSALVYLRSWRAGNVFGRGVVGAGAAMGGGESERLVVGK